MAMASRDIVQCIYVAICHFYNAYSRVEINGNAKREKKRNYYVTAAQYWKRRRQMKGSDRSKYIEEQKHRIKFVSGNKNAIKTHSNGACVIVTGKDRDECKQSDKHLL